MQVNITHGNITQTLVNTTLTWVNLTQINITWTLVLKYNTDIDITHTQVKIIQAQVKITLTQVDRDRQETERNLLHIYASCDLRTSTCNNYINLFGTTYHKRVKSF